MKYFVETSRYGDDWVRQDEEFSSVKLAHEGIEIEDWYKYTARIIDENDVVHSHLIEMGEPIDVAKPPNQVFEDIRNGYGFTVEEFEDLCKKWLSTSHTDED